MSLNNLQSTSNHPRNELNTTLLNLIGSNIPLLLDDFKIKYVGKEHTKQLLGVLKEFYKVEEDWTGSLYRGITIDWHYDQYYVDISMANYVLKQLAKYKQPP